MYINGIKYACSTCIKGHRSSHCNHVDRPLLEIRKKGRPVTQCTFCRDLRKTKQVHIKCTCNDKKNDQPLLINNIQQPTINNDTQSTQLDVKRDINEQVPYSWALVTSPSTNYLNLNDLNQDDSLFTDMLLDDNILPQANNNYNNNNNNSNNSNNSNLHLGFTFHKPNSQRFLDGQPRIRKRKSITKRSNINILPLNNIDTIQSSDSPSIISPQPPSMDNLTDQLEVLSNTNPIQPPEELPMSSTNSNSFVPNCQQRQNSGESVVITITPLSITEENKNPPITTRIVTCYCGSQCSCPGCLVHPNNFFLGNDPYTGPLCPPSSSTSSSCYGSDDEELFKNNYLSFT